MFDEIDFWSKPFQREPTVMEGMFAALANSKNWVRAVDQQAAQRTHAKLKRRREQENCLNGRLPFPIRWSLGTQPTGDRIFYVNIDGLQGGPFPLSATEHQALHKFGQYHLHYETRH